MEANTAPSLICPQCHGTHINPAHGSRINQCLSCRLAFDAESAADAIREAHADECPDVQNCRPCVEEDPHQTENGIVGPR